MASVRIICPNGHLGFAPLKPESFEIGVAARPDFIAADSGSDDIGPVPLGSDTSTSPRGLAAPRSRGDAARLAAHRRADDHRLGRRHRHQQPRRPLRRDHPRPRRQARPRAVQLGYFYSEVDKERVRSADPQRRCRRGPRRPPGAHRSRARRHRAHRRAWPACIRSSSCSTGRRRHHRRALQRLRDLRRAGICTRVSRRPMPTTSARCSNAPRSAPSPTAARRRCSAKSTADGVDCHGDASRPALHGRVGRRTRHVRALEPVLRALRRAASRHDRCHYEQVGRAHHACHRPAFRACRRASA